MTAHTSDSGYYASLCASRKLTRVSYLDVGTLKLADERAIALKHGDVETVAMAVANQHVAGVADVDAVRVVGDVLTADAVQELSVFTEHHDTMTLPTRHQIHTDTVIIRPCTHFPFSLR